MCFIIVTIRRNKVTSYIFQDPLCRVSSPDSCRSHGDVLEFDCTQFVPSGSTQEICLIVLVSNDNLPLSSINLYCRIMLGCLFAGPGCKKTQINLASIKNTCVFKFLITGFTVSDGQETQHQQEDCNSFHDVSESAAHSSPLDLW